MSVQRFSPILIVDDVEETRSVLRRVLQLRGYASADKAVIRLVQVDGKAIKAPDAFRSAMQGHLAGDKVEITVQRGNEQVKLSPSLMATSRIMTPNQQRGAIGATAEETKDGVGIALKTVTATGPAEKAGLKVGDILLKLDGKALDLPSRLTELIADRKPGDMITLLVKNDVPIGNVFTLRDGNKSHLFIISGLYVKDAAVWQKLIEPKLGRLAVRDITTTAVRAWYSALDASKPTRNRKKITPTWLSTFK